MKIVHALAGENASGERVDGVLYFGNVYKVPAAVWKSGAFEAWIMETYPPQAYDAISDMEPVPGGNVELIEVYTPDASGDLWVMWRVPYRKAALKTIGGVR